MLLAALTACQKEREEIDMAAVASESCRRHAPELDFINSYSALAGLKLTLNDVSRVFVKDGQPPGGWRS